MTTVAIAGQSFIDTFEGLRSEPAFGPDWLRELREEAMASFMETGLPVQRRGNEAWKYTDLRRLAETPFAPSAPDSSVSREDLVRLLPFDEGFSRLAFVNGRFSPELNAGLDQPGVTIAPMSQVLASDRSDLREHFAPLRDKASDPFTALNTALFADGAFVEINAELTSPIHIVYLSSAGTDTHATFPRTLIVARPHSRAHIVESYIGGGTEASLTTAVTRVVVGDGAAVSHYRLLLESPASYHIGRHDSVLGRDANYRSVVFETGAGLGRLDSETLFDSTGSSANLKGLYVTAGDQHIDNLISIDHAQPHNTSRLYYKGILDDHSSAVFGGTVFVRKGADKTDAHQEDKNLLLSEDAEVNSKPALEIYADDVKAGHGATAGAVADEALFYMQSRGIDGDTAMRLLVQGFASEILDAVEIEPLRTWLEWHALRALPRFHGEAPA